MKTQIKKLFLMLALLVLGSAPRLNAQTFTLLHSFTTTVTISNGYPINSDGVLPFSLILSGNTLYGTANNGGTNGTGTVFAVNTDGTGFTNLYSFTAPVATNITGYPINSDGALPASLILSGDTLYGVAETGGTNGSGTVFAIKTDGTGFTNLYSFTAVVATNGYTNSDGAIPFGPLILSGDTLYGTATLGGTNGSGTVFAVSTDGTGFTNLHNFTGVLDGANPESGLILSGNTLYGTAVIGGTNGSGTVFAVNTDGTGFTNLHNFTGVLDGANPERGLILSSNILYGTAHGGAANGGAVFKVNTDGADFMTLHTFTGGSGGANPNSPLILSGNTLYGAGSASEFPDSGEGSVFSVNTDGTGFTTLYSFTGGSDGATPGDVLILSGDTLYGTAIEGGSSGNGTVFSILLTPVNGLVFSQITSNQMAFQWNPGQITAMGYLIERSTNGTSFTTLATVGSSTTTYTDNTVSPLSQYYYRVTGTNTNGTTNSLVIYGASSPAAALPTPWFSQDVGAVGGSGASGQTAGIFTSIGSGNGIGGNSDQFQFAYQPIVGNATITARVSANQNTSANALAAVTIRDSLMGGAANVSMGFSGGSSNVCFQSRVVDRMGTSSVAGSGGLSLPCWVRLVRDINTITGYTSTNGVNWTQQGSVNIALGQVVYVGLGATSGTNTLLSTSTFDNVAVLGTPANLAPPVTITLNGSNPLDIQSDSVFVDPGVTVSASPIGIGAGNGNNLVLKADGTLVCWGTGDQTNLPSDANDIVAITEGDYHCLALTGEGTVVGWAYNFWGQATPPADLSNVVAIAAGYGHSMALLTNGTIVAWGDDADGETNVPPNATNIIAIAAGGEHSLALQANGTVIGWGDNTYDQNNPPAGVTNIIAIAETSDCSVALKSDGTVLCWGSSGEGETSPPVNATNIVGISGGTGSSVFLAMKADGSVIGWGYSGRGQTTIPVNVTNVLALATGATQELAVDSDGTLVIWGNADFGPTNVITGLDTINETPILGGTVNTQSPGSYTLTYTVQDALGTVGMNSRAVVVLPPLYLSGTMLPANGGFQLGFTNTPGLSFSVLSTTNLALPLANWSVLGSVQEISSGQYQFTDTQTINLAGRFYRVQTQ